MRISTILPPWLLLAAACVSPVGAQVAIDVDATVTVDQLRGADPTLDYASLLRLGPWDDRNYSLTAADLALLGKNEQQIREALPAFYRVELRRARPDLSRDSHARYPHTALNTFMRIYGGFLIDGRHYESVRLVGGRYLLDLGAPAAATTDGPTDQLTGESRVSFPEGESEAAVAISPGNANLAIAGSVRPSSSQEMYYSGDGGQTWLPSSLPLGGTCCDPAVAWSSNGALSYATSIGSCSVGGCDLYFYRSSDGGASWTDLESVTPGEPRRTLDFDADRETLHVDTSALSPFKDSVYVAYHNGNVMQLARSRNQGDGWSAVALSSAAEDLGIAGSVTTDRAGTLYYAWPAYDSQTIRFATSTDGGASFSASAVIAATEAAYEFSLPAQDTRQVLIYVASDSDLSDGPYSSSIYVAWSDTTAPATSTPATNHSRVRVAASHDGGSTWTITSPHPTNDQQTVDRFHPYLRVGPDGTVHVVFYDTSLSPDRTGVDIYYSFSTDVAQSFSTPRRVTSQTSPGILDWFEFGDYIGLDMAMNSLITAFADNRSETGVPGDSVDVYAAAIDPGPGSGSAGRIPGSEGVGGNPMLVSKNANGSELDLNWDVACGNGTDYEVYEGLLGDPQSKQPLLCSTGGTTSATITPARGARFYLVVAAVSTAEGSYGRSSDGAERLPDPGACLAQMIGACP